MRAPFRCESLPETVSLPLGKLLVRSSMKSISTGQACPSDSFDIFGRLKGRKADCRHHDFLQKRPPAAQPCSGAAVATAAFAHRGALAQHAQPSMSATNKQRSRSRFGNSRRGGVSRLPTCRSAPEDVHDHQRLDTPRSWISTVGTTS